MVPGLRLFNSFASATARRIVIASMKPGTALQETTIAPCAGSTFSTNPVAGYFWTAYASVVRVIAIRIVGRRCLIWLSLPWLRPLSPLQEDALRPVERKLVQ